jgi:hypothetical protein
LILMLRWAVRKGRVQHDCVSGVLAGIDDVVDTERYLLVLHCSAGRGQTVWPHVTGSKAN